MGATKADIIAQLQRDILPLQGYAIPLQSKVETGLGPVLQAFPTKTFPTGAVHEFCSWSPESSAATGGFVSGVLGPLMQNNGVCIWISSYRTIFPPALQSFGIAPESVIFINLRKEKEMLWAMEESLKCESLVAVVGEIQEMSFTNSRRLQLAVEKSRVTGFVLRHHPKTMQANACIARWQITSLPGEADGFPGVGFPKWNVELLKVRNGKPGKWELSYYDNQFHAVGKIHPIPQMVKVNAG